MAKVLTCPACGAPLSLDDDDRDGVVECFYCKRHVVVATGALTQAPAKKVVASPQSASEAAQAREAKRERREAKRQRREERKQEGEETPQNKNRRVALFTVGMLVAGAAVVYVTNRAVSSIDAPDRPPVDEVLRKLDLNSDEAQAAALFGVKPGAGIPNQLTVDAQQPGVVSRTHLSWEFPDKRTISRVSVSYQAGKKPKDILDKLGALVPNRLRPGPTARVSQGDAVLDVGDHGFNIWHWGSVHPPNADYAGCAQRISALWSVARAVGLDGPTPTPAELELVNGPKLERAAELDTSIPVEQAVDYFQKKYSAGWCRMQAGLLCVVDVDDKLVDNVRYTWPNGLRARVGQAKLELIQDKATDKALRAVAGCLEPVLGKGTETVVDYVRGTRNWEWRLGRDGSGDRVLLAGRTLLISSAEGAPLDQPAAWHDKLQALFSALAACPG